MFLLNNIYKLTHPPAHTNNDEFETTPLNTHKEHISLHYETINIMLLILFIYLLNFQNFFYFYIKTLIHGPHFKIMKWDMGLKIQVCPWFKHELFELGFFITAASTLLFFLLHLYLISSLSWINSGEMGQCHSIDLCRCHVCRHQYGTHIAQWEKYIFCNS